MKYSEADLLKIVGEERKRSIGFGEGDSGELQGARERALLYYRGDVSKDVPSAPNRSAAVSTDVAEAVETVLPDLIEIFVGGDDVATFAPVGPEDEEAAQQETDYVNHVVFNENDGFTAFYSAIKDALLVRTGLFHWWWEDGEEFEEDSFEGKSADEIAVAQASGLEIADLTENPAGGYDFKVRRRKDLGKVCVKAVPPEDFTVARDTVSLKDATYCALRDRPRVQDLIARGVDPETARGLPSYGSSDETIEEARDTSGEESQNRSEATGDLRQVEVRAHYIRIEEDGKLCLYRVVTDSRETVLVEPPEKVEAIPFGPLTPYLNTHRFYGISVADKLIEISQIKTVLVRMMLDSGYFALNQRMEVAMSGANEFTISDLLRNEPNMPIRTAQPGMVRPVSAGALNFDVFGALEHVSVMGEHRTGIMRNAQGLNPDTLHDTAKGAQALMSAAQKRVRLIARVFAETGVKDLFLGVHALIRKHATAGSQARLRGKWVPVDPTEWGARKDMTIQVGLGSAGREQDLMVAMQTLEIQERLIGLQGGVSGPFVTADSLHNALTNFARASNQKAPERVFPDPKDAEPQPPKPDPEMERAKAELRLKQQEGQANLAIKAQEGQQKAQLAQAQAEQDFELQRMKIEGELQLKRETTAAELQMKREVLIQELQMKRELGLINAQVAAETGMAKVAASSSVSEVEPGGEPG